MKIGDKVIIKYQKSDIRKVEESGTGKIYNRMVGTIIGLGTWSANIELIKTDARRVKAFNETYNQGWIVKPLIPLKYVSDYKANNMLETE